MAEISQLNRNLRNAMRYAKAARGEATAKKSQYNQDQTKKSKIISNTFEKVAKKAELKVKELTRRMIEQQVKPIYPTTSPLYQGKEYKLKTGNIFNLQAETERRKAAKAERIHREKEATAKAAANKAAANLAIKEAESRREAANARALEANARANAAEKAAKESKSAANQAAANRARANANRAAANARSAALAATTAHLTGVITGAIKNKVPGAPKNKIPSKDMGDLPPPLPPKPGPRQVNGNNNKKRNTRGGVIQTQTVTIGNGGKNTAAIITALAQFTKSAAPTMNATLLQHLKNIMAQKSSSANLTQAEKKELMDQLVMLMEEREQLRAKTNNASKTRLAVVEIKIKTTRQLLKALGITMTNNNNKPVIPKNKNNLNQVLSITNRFTRLQKLYELFRQTKDTARKMRLAREIRLVIAKMYGSNVSTSNAIRNITNAGRIVGRGAVSKNVNRNLETAMKILKNEAKSGGKRSGLRPSGSSSYAPGRAYGGSSSYAPGRAYGGMNMHRGGVNMGRTAGGTGGGAPPITISISNIGKVSNAGKTQVSNIGKAANSGTTGQIAASAPTTNGSRQLAATSEQLIRGAGGAEAVEQGINALRAANGNVARAKATSRLPNNTFTNIYAMGGPVAAKRLVEQRRRRRVGPGARSAPAKKKRVARKPKKYIKLTPYQFKRLTDYIKKNNLRKVLIKEIYH